MANSRTYKKNGYGAYAATYGSLAYDLGALGYPEEREAFGAPEDYAREEPREAVRPREVPAPKHITPACALSLLVAGGMLVLVLLSYVRLSEVSITSGKLVDSIAQLRGEQAKLNVQYESAVNIDEIETYAREQLGMTAPESYQIDYVNLSAPDKAVILSGAANRDAGGFISAIRSFLIAAVEYFK